MFSLILRQVNSDARYFCNHPKGDEFEVAWIGDKCYFIAHGVDGLDIKFRLPIIDIAIRVLKLLSLNQYQTFRDNLVALIEMDSRVDLLEWSLQKILFNHLDGQFFKPASTKTHYSRVVQLKNEITLILSILAYAGQQDQNDVQVAYSSATKTPDLKGLQLVTKNEISFSYLDDSLKELEKLKPLAKQQLLKDCAVCVVYDNRI